MMTAKALKVLVTPAQAMAGLGCAIGARSFYTSMLRDSVQVRHIEHETRNMSPWHCKEESTHSGFLSSLPNAQGDAQAAMMTWALSDELLNRFYSGSFQKNPVRLGRVNDARVEESVASAEWAKSDTTPPTRESFQRQSLAGTRQWVEQR